MKRNTLSVFLVASLFAGSAIAQDRAGTFDDRWYLTVGSGANIQDSDRDTENAPHYALGAGKFINPNWSLDFELNHQNPKLNPNEDLNWSQYGASLDARRHFRTEGRTWNPYVLMGVGYGRAEEEFVNFGGPSPGQRKDGFATTKLGAGVQGDFDRVSVRGELYAKTSFDNDSVLNPGESNYTDGIAQISLLVPLGERSVAQARPAPEVGQWEQPAPQPEPVPQYEEPMSVDLPVVYFEFDRSELSGEGRAALDQAAEVLRNNPSLRARVHGHTDSKGSEQYNQGLSERRAEAAAQYLTSRGVAANQIVEVVGYGETRPVAPNTHEDGSDNPQGRAQNRRAELQTDQ